MNKKQIARLTDSWTGTCTCHNPPITTNGTIITGSDDFDVNGLPVARHGDTVLGDCGHTGTIVASGEGLVDGIKVALLGDGVTGCLTDGNITTASPDSYNTNMKYIVVANVVLPFDQNSIENAQTIIDEQGFDAIDDEFETTDGAAQYPPLQNPPPPSEIVEQPIEEADDIDNQINTEPVACEDITVPLDYNLNISPNFKLRNASIDALFPHAIKAQNGLTEAEIACNLKALCVNVLEPLWEKYPDFRINSGFRSYQNGRSQHEYGQAVDIQWSGITFDEYWERANWVKDNLDFDQFIYEHGNSIWFHLSYNNAGNRPKTTLNAILTMKDGKYKHGLKRYY